jgi:hypothetical protein
MKSRGKTTHVYIYDRKDQIFTVLPNYAPECFPEMVFLGEVGPAGPSQAELEYFLIPLGFGAPFPLLEEDNIPF